MSFWTNAVDFHTPTLTVGQWAVLSIIAQSANDAGESRPSMDTLAIKAHCQEHNVRRTLKDLQTAGYIKRSGRGIYILSKQLLACPDGCYHTRGAEMPPDAPGSVMGVPPEKQPSTVAKEQPGSTRTKPQSQPTSLTGLDRAALRLDPWPTVEPGTSLPAVLADLEQAGDPFDAGYQHDPIVRAEATWRDAYLTDPPPGMLLKKMKSLFATQDAAAVLDAWDTYCHNTGPQYVNVDKFVATWGAWRDGPPPKSGPPSADPLAAHRRVFGG